MPKLDIAIVGEINLDLILYGLPQHMPTELELLATDFSMTLGSSSAILAHNLAALGARVGLITKAGNDSFGTLALDRLRECNVDLTKVVHGTKSGVTLILPHGKERHILTYPGTISELRFEELDLDYLASARHFHMSSLFLQRELLPHVPELFRRMKSAGLTTSLDTNDDPDDRWGTILDDIFPHLDILMPNQREAMKMSRTESVETAIKALAQKVETVVVKLGAQGATAATKKGSQRFTAAPIAVDVIDPIGAGDSFDAGFLYQFLQKSDLETCLHYGNLCGAYSTTASGGTEAFRNPTRMHQFLEQ